ncbi:hypothetical protein [Erwinia sp. E_sp_B01_9]|uniref:hypothetical protein n=1 Tax=Erwinia sp. E_sp_B01_9 TaxID=3039403 RepID=UPI003D9B88FC
MSIVIDNSGESDNENGGLTNSRDINSSLQIYQQMYQHITGRSENMKQICSDNLLIDMQEIKQLHFKINQLRNIHNIIAQNETVTVFHAKERKEQFTSFEKFEIYNSSTTSPTLNVILKYNFAILPTGRVTPNQYTVTLKINSRIAWQKQMEEDAPPFMRGRFISFMLADAAEIDVEYADYVVARTFIEAFKEWTEGCSRASNSFNLMNKLQFISHYIPSFFKFIFSLSIVLLAMNSVELFVNESASPEKIAKFSIIFFSCFFIFSSVARFLGSNIEGVIDRYVPLSYLKLNKGDERLIEEYVKKKREIIVKWHLI